MPRVSYFYGISIYMYYQDHAPPHFHAIYGEHEAAISIGERTLIKGQLPRRVHALVGEWATIHEEELMTNWHRAQQAEPLEQIQPLD